MEEEVFGPEDSSPVAVEFEWECRSPWEAPLGAPFDTVHRVEGLCPLCNNTKHAELDRLLLERGPGALVAKGFSKAAVAHHLVSHLAPTLRDVATDIGGIIEIATTILEAGGGLPPSFSRLVDKAPRCGESGPRVGDGGAWGVVSAWNSGYAFDGTVQKKRLSPWSAPRAAGELRKRMEETFNYLDKMKGIEKKAARVYREIMDGGDVKTYSVAVAALHEMRGVYTDLAKVGLLATQIAGQEGEGKKLSPYLESLVSEITGKMKPALPDTSDAQTVPVRGLPGIATLEAAP